MDDQSGVLIAKALSIQLCVREDYTDAQAIALAERDYPCGTTNGWGISKRVEQRVPCAERAGYVHMILDA